PALARSAHRRMQHAVSREHFQGPVVHSDGNVHRYFLVGILQVLVDALFEAEFLGGFFKTRFRVLVDIHLFWCGRSLRHSGLSARNLGFMKRSAFRATARTPRRKLNCGFFLEWPGNATFGRLPTAIAHRDGVSVYEAALHHCKQRCGTYVRESAGSQMAKSYDFGTRPRWPCIQC